jgi:uncharacterized protein
MILETVIIHVIEQQRERLKMRDTGFKRELIPDTQSLSSHALIISGIKRCGKSTLLMQMIRGMTSVLYLNFDTPQLYEFSVPDFLRLDGIITKDGYKILFFDELQLVEGWEMYVRQKLDEEFQVVITGSNASLLSKELGTRLTGRHLTQELFPFSYNEFFQFRNLQANAGSVKQYMEEGGFPEFLKTKDEEQLYTLFNDILIRDIVARYGIKDAKSLHRLALFLFSNVGNRITATKLKQLLSISATTTVLSWLSYLELSYLVFFVPQYSHSTKARLINPRKVYAIDLGLVERVSNNLTMDIGRKLENLIFLHLRKKYKDIYYFEDREECDFIAIKKGTVEAIVQVCYELNMDNLKRELKGLLNAMHFFNVKKAVIVTFDNSDFIKEADCAVDVIPAYKYLMM